MFEFTRAAIFPTMADDEFNYTMVPLVSHDFFWVTFSGELGLGRLARAHDAFTNHPDYAEGIDELLDFTDTSIKQMTRKEIESIRAYMATQSSRHDCRSVIVVSSELEYGLGRMMSPYLDKDAPMDRHVSYSVCEALDWLRPGQAEELLAAYQRALEAGA